jgi:hypothetical protein
MEDCTVVNLYLASVKKLERLGYEVELSPMKVFVVRRKGKESPYVRQVAIFIFAESLHAFAYGVHDERSKAKKKGKKKKG